MSRTFYEAEINTYVTFVDDKSWDEMRRHHIMTVGTKLALGGAQQSKPRPQKDQIPDSIRKALEEQGAEITPKMEEHIKNTLMISSQRDSSKVVLATPDGVIMNWLSWQNHPTQPAKHKKKVQAIPLVHRIRRNKKYVNEGEHPTMPLFPIQGTTYRYYVPSMGDPTFVARKGFGRQAECVSYNYKRNPEGLNYGSPVRKPDWLEVRACEKCGYAPHRDKSKDKEEGITNETACKHYRQLPVLVECTFQDRPAIIGPIFWELQGQLDYQLMVNSSLGRRPHYRYIYSISDWQMLVENMRKKRVFTDTTDDNNPEFLDGKKEEDQDVVGMVRLISGSFKSFFQKKQEAEEAKYQTVAYTEEEEETYDEVDDIAF